MPPGLAQVHTQFMLMAAPVTVGARDCPAGKGFDTWQLVEGAGVPLWGGEDPFLAWGGVTGCRDSRCHQATHLPQVQFDLNSEAALLSTILQGEQ